MKLHGPIWVGPDKDYCLCAECRYRRKVFNEPEPVTREELMEAMRRARGTTSI